MIILAIVLALAFAFVLDLVAAYFMTVVAPYTGIDVLAGLDFWNMFFLSLFVTILMLPSLIVGSSK